MQIENIFSKNKLVRKINENVFFRQISGVTDNPCHHLTRTSELRSIVKSGESHIKRRMFLRKKTVPLFANLGTALTF